MFDANGCVVLFNEHYRALMGAPAEFLQGLSLLDLFKHRRTTGDFVGDPEKFFADVMADVRAGKWDTKIMESPNGRTLRVTDRPMAGGGWVATFEDITEARKAEAAIREYVEREQLFVAAVESSNDAIVTKNLDGVITGWNQAAERLFGFTAQEAIGKSIDIVVPVELRDEVRDILGKIKNGEKVDHHETVRVHKTGRRIDVSLSVSPIRSQSGTIIGAAKVARDIGARKKAQEALLESEQMSRAIIDTALDAFIQLDASGTVISWSPKAEEMLGWPTEEVIGQKLGDLLITAESREAYSERIAQFLRDADKGVLGRRYEAPSLRRDGSRLSTEVSLTALRRRDGYIINGFIRDITEKVVAEEQLKHAQKMESVGQLTGGIAHDFNNMLTVITGTIDILGDAVADKPQLAAIAKLISEAADRGAELTGHLLAFARKQPLQPRETDINALMVDSGKLLRPALGEHIEIETSLMPDVWPALVDPNQLSSALLNLAINARDAMPNGGKLTLETSNVVLDQNYVRINADVAPGDYVLVAVSDTGQGIPEAIRNKVFEPFFTTKDVGKGTGLGLSMVYGFVKQSGGHIKVYSEEGHGTTFRIYLPRAGAQAEPIASAQADSQIDGGNETILIVEDDALVRTSVTAQVQSLGYKTLLAANAAEALAIADRGTPFDLLFTDVIMPGKMNGRQLAEEMARRRSPLKVLFTSGYTENAIIHHGRLDPGVLLLAKPYRKMELARMIRRALDAVDGSPAGVGDQPKSQAI
jgi:PAS domain S-box-containing protein